MPIWFLRNYYAFERRWIGESRDVAKEAAASAQLANVVECIIGLPHMPAGSNQWNTSRLARNTTKAHLAHNRHRYY